MADSHEMFARPAQHSVRLSQSAREQVRPCLIPFAADLLASCYQRPGMPHLVSAGLESRGETSHEVSSLQTYRFESGPAPQQDCRGMEIAQLPRPAGRGGGSCNLDSLLLEFETRGAPAA